MVKTEDDGSSLLCSAEEDATTDFPEITAGKSFDANRNPEQYFGANRMDDDVADLDEYN